MTISEEIMSSAVVSLHELFPNYTEQLIKPFERMVNPDIHKGIYLNFELGDREQKNKINPILRLAQPEDAEEIVGIYRELYNGTYPYKEMEDVEEVRKMIQNPSIEWLVYQDPSYNIAGCITFVLDFGNKRGYIRGFMLKKAYQGYLDITKAMIGSMIGMIYRYKNKIYVWYVENRTAHAKSQYSMWVCGIAPIGFYPNKDVFMGKVESDLMQICYDEKALRSLREQRIPRILPEIEDCYLYSANRYNLGSYKIEVPAINLDKKKLNFLRERLKITSKLNNFGYETIKFEFLDTNSYFEFLYTPHIQNIEKTRYNVNNLEELYVFVEKFIKYVKERNIRYCEVFISAYKSDHQKVFLNVGLSPRGYIPSWKYNTEKEVFEDSILFNWYKGVIGKDIQLIEEGKKFLDILNQNNDSPENKALQKVPLFYDVKDKVSNVWNYRKTVKSSLMIGLILYLFMLIGSIFVAKSFGYHIISHTVSELGTMRFTPLPFMFDCACVIGGLTTILLYLYLSKRIIVEEDTLTNRLSRYGVFIGAIGSIGIITLGIFSLDRSGPLGIFHILSSILAFGGFVLALFTYGITFSRKKSIFLKMIGINGFVPFIVLVGNFIFPCPLLEWILLFTILTSLIPLFCWVSFR